MTTANWFDDLIHVTKYFYIPVSC